MIRLLTRRWPVLLMTGALLPAGCLAMFQGNLDLLLGSGAIGNAIRLPYSSVWGLAEFLLRLGRG